MRIVVVLLALLVGCGKNQTVEVKQNPPKETPVKNEDTSEEANQFIDFKTNFDRDVLGEKRYNLRLEWRIPASMTNDFDVWELKDGKFRSRCEVMPIDIADHRHVNSTTFRLEWGSLYRYEIRRSTEETIDLLFDGKLDEARNKEKLVKLITIDLRENL